MKTNLLTLAILAFVCVFTSIKVQGASDTATGTVDVAQTLTITNGGAASGSIAAIDGSASLTTVWTVTTNNAFTIAFTGTSKQDTGTTENAFPLFTKQDVDAAGSAIANNYDNLATAVGLVASGHRSLTGTATWEGGASPTGTTANLVATTGGSKPSLGTIMTDDNSSTAVITLTASGTRDVGDQSGNYVMTVTATATADEQL